MNSMTPRVGRKSKANKHFRPTQHKVNPAGSKIGRQAQAKTLGVRS